MNNMRNRLLLYCVAVFFFSSMNIHCFNEVVVRRKYKSSLMDEAVCMIFVRRLYNDGDTFCFEFPYNCGVVKDFPRIVYRIKNENCTTVSQFKDYVNWEFQRIRNSVNKKWRREKPKLNKVKSASSSSAPPLIL